MVKSPVWRPAMAVAPTEDLLDEHVDAGGFQGAADALPGGDHAVLLARRQRQARVEGGRRRRRRAVQHGRHLGVFDVGRRRRRARPARRQFRQLAAHRLRDPLRDPVRRSIEATTTTTTITTKGDLHSDARPTNGGPLVAALVRGGGRGLSPMHRGRDGM